MMTKEEIDFAVELAQGCLENCKQDELETGISHRAVFRYSGVKVCKALIELAMENKRLVDAIEGILDPPDFELSPKKEYTIEVMVDSVERGESVIDDESGE